MAELYSKPSAAAVQCKLQELFASALQSGAVTAADLHALTNKVKSPRTKSVLKALRLAAFKAGQATKNKAYSGAEKALHNLEIGYGHKQCPIPFSVNRPPEFEAKSFDPGLSGSKTVANPGADALEKVGECVAAVVQQWPNPIERIEFVDGDEPPTDEERQLAAVAAAVASGLAQATGDSAYRRASEFLERCTN